MFFHDTERFVNPVGDFRKNYVKIGSLIEILVDSLHSWMSIGRHFPVTPAVCYDLAEIATSN